MTHDCLNVYIACELNQKHMSSHTNGPDLRGTEQMCFSLPPPVTCDHITYALVQCRAMNADDGRRNVLTVTKPLASERSYSRGGTAGAATKRHGRAGPATAGRHARAGTPV